MTKEQYAAKRTELLAKAQAAIDASDLATAQATNTDIENLDKKFEDEAKALADLNALRNKAVIDLPTAAHKEPANLKPAGAAIIDPSPKDEDKIYRRAFGGFIKGDQISDKEREIFNKINPGIYNTAQMTATHQVVIPNTLVQEIWQEAAELHPVLSMVPMTTIKGKVTYPKENGDGSDAAWYDEATEVADGDVAETSIELDAYELAKCIPVSWLLKNMAIDAFLVYVRQNLAQKMGDALATALFSGKGKAGESASFKSQPLGIVTAIEAEASTPQLLTWGATDAVTYAKLTKFMSMMKSGYVAGASIFAKNDFIWNTLANILDGNNRPYFVPDVTAGGVGRILGKVVYEEDGVPADGMVMANFTRGYKLNSQENVTMYSEDHMKARITDYMAYAQIDGKPISTTPFVYLKKSA